jgi:hypothetical protein
MDQIARSFHIRGGYKVSFLLHVHPPIGFIPKRWDRTVYNHSTGQLEALTARNLPSGYPSGASRLDYRSYTRIAGFWKAYGAQPSLGIIDSTRSYIEYQY